MIDLRVGFDFGLDVVLDLGFIMCVICTLLFCLGLIIVWVNALHLFAICLLVAFYGAL